MHGSPNKSYRSAQRLDRVIAEVNSQLAELKAKWEADRGVLAREKAEIATREKQWQDERQTLAKENAALRDAASKANAGASGTAKGRNVAEKEATLREHAAVYYVSWLSGKSLGGRNTLIDMLRIVLRTRTAGPRACTRSDA